MKLDRDTLETILKSDNATLWRTIRGIAAMSGVTLPEKIPEKEIEGIRRALSHADDSDIERANETLENYKNRKE